MAATETKEKEAVLLAAHTAEEMDEIEDRVLVSALGDNDGNVAEEIETGTGCSWRVASWSGYEDTDITTR